MGYPDSREEALKARGVKHMFSAIAHRYDFLNHFLSGNIDRYWRRVCLREVGGRLSVNRPAVLDIGCGTADLSLVFSRIGRVVGCDFCHPMLRIGLDKVARAGKERSVDLLEGDALALPFADASFDAVVSAFVLRNLADIDKGLKEMRRVLRPGGVLGILDFAMPRVVLLGTLYRFYFTRILPRLGKLISGVDGAYMYLPDSVRKFPHPEVLEQHVLRAGFSKVEHRTITSGIAVLLLGEAGDV